MIAGTDDIFDRTMSMAVADVDEIYSHGKRVSKEPIYDSKIKVGFSEVWLYEGMHYLIERYSRESLIVNFW
jgi:hypothetical protein